MARSGSPDAPRLAAPWNTAVGRHPTPHRRPEDYLDRCRAFLTERGGFSGIPGRRTPKVPSSNEPALGDENLDLRLRMQRAGVTQRQLAERSGVTEAFVSTVLKGDEEMAPRDAAPDRAVCLDGRVAGTGRPVRRRHECGVAGDRQFSGRGRSRLVKLVTIGALPTSLWVGGPVW